MKKDTLKKVAVVGGVVAAVAAVAGLVKYLNPIDEEEFVDEDEIDEMIDDDVD